MKRLNPQYLLVALALFLCGTVLGVQLNSYVSESDALEHFEKMKRAFVIINGKYVERLDAAEVAEEGVKGMMSSLDPHSGYVPAEQAERNKERYEGSFGGIGIRFEVVDDTARVVSPIAGGPSAKAGVQAGDRIVQIKDSTAIGITETGVRERLTGEIGTEVSFTVYRPFSDTRHTFTIERGEIPLYSIHSSYMIDDQTGYVEIGRFAKSTYDEFMKKVDTLKNQGMERLVLDLRNNNGGVMQPAIKIADEMLGAGMTIVRTKGRSSQMNTQYPAQAGGALTDEPVIVLVNRNSASASEILSGALQDNDRALLVGERTFGKALVQRHFELNDNSLLKMTVGRYYTPLGRLVQTPYEKGKAKQYYKNKSANMRDAMFNVEKYRDSIPDSLTYETTHGRKVFGGGGILPDYVVKQDTSSLSFFLRRSRASAYFARHWFSKHEQDLRSTWREREDEFLASYTVPDEAVPAFWTYLEEEDVLTLTTDTSEVNSEEGVFPKSEANGLDDLVKTRVKARLADELYGVRAGKSLINDTDPIVQKAMSLWPSSNELATYHTSSSTNN